MKNNTVTMNNTTLWPVMNQQDANFTNKTSPPMIPPRPPDLMITYIIDAYINTAVVVTGMLLNFLVILLMRRHAFKHKIIALYFTTLALSDSLFLLVTFVGMSLPRLSGVQFSLISDVTCAFMRFLIDVSHLWSNTILCSLSVSRAIVVCNPFYREKIDSSFRTKMAFLGTGIIIMLLSSYSFWMAKIVDLHGMKMCMVSEKYLYFELSFRMWIKSILTVYLPIVILVSCNLVIGIQLRKRKQNQENLAPGARNKDRTHIEFLVTAMVICLVYAGLTVTMTLMGMLSSLMPINAMWTSRGLAITLGLCSHSCNFFLYICSNKQFLFELKKMFKKMHQQNDDNESSGANSENRNSISNITNVTTM